VEEEEVECVVGKGDVESVRGCQEARIKNCGMELFFLFLKRRTSGLCP
jgi:hypothetical protein